MAEKSSHWRLTFLFILLVIVAIFFLRDTYWKTALSEQEFVNLYVEVVKLQTRWADQPLKARTETKKLLASEGVSEEQLNRFVEQVNKKPERWVKIWEKINKELEKTGQAGDTILPRNR